MQQLEPIKTQQTMARIAGASFLCLILLAIFGEFYLLSDIWNYESFTATAQNIRDNLTKFKMATTFELLAFIGVIILANALFSILKHINKNLAQLALYIRIAEAAVFAVILLNRFAIIILVSDAEYLKAFNPEEIAGLVGLFTEIYNVGYSFGMIFFGLGSTFFCFLLYKSSYIPKILGLLGIISSISVFIGLSVQLILPEGSMSVLYPGLGIMVFEIITGFWLLIKGVSYRQKQ